MLSVNVQNLLAQLAQLGDGERTGIDPALVAPIALDLPLQQQFSVFVGADAGLVKPLQCGQITEYCADKGGFCPGADQIPTGALPQHGADGVDHNGFARAGLAGQGVEALSKLDVRRLDQGDILDIQQR